MNKECTTNRVPPTKPPNLRSHAVHRICNVYRWTLIIRLSRTSTPQKSRPSKCTTCCDPPCCNPPYQYLSTLQQWTATLNNTQPIKLLDRTLKKRILRRSEKWGPSLHQNAAMLPYWLVFNNNGERIAIAMNSHSGVKINLKTQTFQWEIKKKMLDLVCKQSNT